MPRRRRTEQALQEEDPAGADVPAGQDCGMLVPGGQLEPAGHWAHDEAPSEAAYVPAGQL